MEEPGGGWRLEVLNNPFIFIQRGLISINLWAVDWRWNTKHHVPVFSRIEKGEDCFEWKWKFSFELSHFDHCRFYIQRHFFDLIYRVGSHCCSQVYLDGELFYLQLLSTGCTSGTPFTRCPSTLQLTIHICIFICNILRQIIFWNLRYTCKNLLWNPLWPTKEIFQLTRNCRRKRTCKKTRRRKCPPVEVKMTTSSSCSAGL